MHISLLEFFKTGHFGDVRLGMFREEVTVILGEPKYKKDRKHGSHWIYGYISFFFPPTNQEDNGLYWIHCDQIFAPLYQGNAFILDDSIIGSPLSLTEAEKLFVEHNVIYKKCEYEEPGGETHYRLTLASDVNLYFLPHRLYPDIPNTYHLTIFSKKRTVQYRIPYEERLATITIDIPMTTYNMLQKIATTSKKSVKRLTGELLTQTLSKMPESNAIEDSE